jgi:hypothetical protein
MAWRQKDSGEKRVLAIIAFPWQCGLGKLCIAAGTAASVIVAFPAWKLGATAKKNRCQKWDDILCEKRMSSRF